MVLGLRSKSRKRVSIQVHYIIHVLEIKPWPPSQSLRSVQSVFLQWENGDKNSGSLPSTAGNGKIEFNESFRLSVLMCREASKKGKHPESFQKNCLEFYLYDKTVKSQLLGSAIVNLADFGIIKETKALSIVFNCKKSFRNSSQPFLYVTIQPFDIESSSSSPSSSLSKELSLEKEGSESVSQSLKDDDDLEIASFTDDDSDDIPSNTSQTSRSASEITGDSTKISRGREGSHGEFVLPSESTTASLNGNTEGEPSTQFSGINSPSSSTVLSSDVGIAAHGRPLLPKISEEIVKLADASSEIQKSIQQYSPSYISSSMKPNFERSLQPQVTQEDSMTQEDGTRDQRFNKDSLEKVSNVSKTGVLDDKEKMKEGRKGQEQFTMRNELLENELVKNSSDDGSIKKGKFNSTTLLLNKKTHEHPMSILMNDKTEDVTNVKSPPQSSENYGMFISNQNFERSLQSQVTQEDSMTQEDGTRDRRFNNDSLEKVSSVSKTGVMDDKEKMKKGRKGQEQFTMRNELLENELVSNLSDDGSTKKGKFNSTTFLLNKKTHEHPTSILIDDKTVDVTNVKSPPQSAENYGMFSSNQTHIQAEEINTTNDVHVGTSCHEDVNVNGSFLNNETELKAEVEMLQEELREAAALEVSMYSVIAEHGSSSNKVHAPARRLSRFYFHACRVGSPDTMASAAQSAVSGFVLVSKACGNDVPRLTFWFSNLILLRAIVSKEVERDGNGNTLHKEEKPFHSWEDPETFLVALEKVEAWIFSRIVESVWWQTLTPYMQSAAAKSSSSRKAYEKRYRVGDQDQGNFSIDLWKRAFKDACERICPLRAGGHECGCLPVIARLVMEQLVSRLDVAMFNAILRESAEEMPMDPISDPISDSKVLPIPAGKSGFGAGAQLKNAIGDWSRWLSDLFSIDDSDSREVINENNEPKCEPSFKPFQFLNALSDLMMLPLDMLADGSMRKEVCPKFGISLMKRVVYNFVPDEFSPGPIPDAVFEALDEDIEDDEGAITSFPCSAGSTFYEPPPASSVVGMLQEVGTKTSLRSGSFVLKKLYTSDDELDELDSPLSALGMDDSSLLSKELVKGGRKVVRYELLREAWKTSE
ncbi:hypothetical protein AAZX31_10G171600 [Glycine max]|uniref:C2 NT-type domain-containing protein n=4 Tax=Glycine subgen. Soja TaxID=1462606 RepID=K7LK51_SOYBN|nr:uncharacterized protein LOC100783630 isoform X1 [Glycine max]XP_014618743.1 uncharacterized protein LOC100783630 isoform X1 [Glycine max]XP_014618744.1 uncharacterized protein LOC100783630 isoform X1 [Glycine max]XP_014618745.1 uncharacterized protein LOC100783630 isoform X1 [Glycine max]XP_028183743.1 uncharacterized protein LOC114370560 [Glycine soja]XP_028183744.1 uncharacterized protein LOC114370560 [Glycine soja]XP_028183745.1 uncharacterized protein LOC114370560 [Glycine soja]XP_028|eukprot:XP_014618742.1 uncharacterized protein LOC100783630 [Glycine max]